MIYLTCVAAIPPATRNPIIAVFIFSPFIIIIFGLFSKSRIAFCPLFWKQSLCIFFPAEGTAGEWAASAASGGTSAVGGGLLLRVGSPPHPGVGVGGSPVTPTSGEGFHFPKMPWTFWPLFLSPLGSPPPHRGTPDPLCVGVGRTPPPSPPPGS